MEFVQVLYKYKKRMVTMQEWNLEPFSSIKNVTIKM